MEVCRSLAVGWGAHGLPSVSGWGSGAARVTLRRILDHRRSLMRITSHVMRTTPLGLPQPSRPSVRPARLVMNRPGFRGDSIP